MGALTGRDLDDCSDNELEINDAKTGKAFTFFYSDIDTSDIVQYRGLAYEKKGSKVKHNITAAQIFMALKKINGFSENYFKSKGAYISSDEEKENYYPGWKKLLKEKAPDLLVIFSTAVFEGSSVRVNASGIEAEYERPEGEELDFDDLLQEEGEQGGKVTEPGAEEEVPLVSSSGE
jgi:hypothetical protein